MTLALVIIAAVALALLGVWLVVERNAEPEVTPEPQECDACGQMIEGDRCKLVQVFGDAGGAGTAMSATFHPTCCPVTDPEHRHAGSGQRVT